MEIKILKINEDNSAEDLRKLIDYSAHYNQFFFVQISNMDLFMLLRHTSYKQFQLDKEFMERSFENIKNQLKEIQE